MEAVPPTWRRLRQFWFWQDQTRPDQTRLTAHAALDQCARARSGSGRVGYEPRLAALVREQVAREASRLSRPRGRAVSAKASKTNKKRKAEGDARDKAIKWAKEFERLGDEDQCTFLQELNPRIRSALPLSCRSALELPCHCSARGSR